MTQTLLKAPWIDTHTLIGAFGFNHRRQFGLDNSPRQQYNSLYIRSANPNPCIEGTV
jgi:hypothetical protein